MAKRRIQPSDEEIARRARGVARQLTGRIYSSENGIYLVGGSPDFDKLINCLKNLHVSPSSRDAPTPIELGFSPEQITALNSSELAARGRALQKWRKILQDYAKARRRMTENHHKHFLWQNEVALLSDRLEHLWDTVRAWESGQPMPNAPYVLAPTKDAVGSALAGPYIPELDVSLWQWFEWLVTWIAGPPAGQRFYESLRSSGFSHSEQNERSALMDTIDRLQALQHRRSTPPAAETAKFIRSILAHLPPEQLERWGVTVPKRLRDIFSWNLIAACENTLKTRFPPPTLVAAAAALCCTDGAITLVPQCLIAPGEIKNKVPLFQTLVDECNKPGYEKVLAAMDAFEDVTKIDIPALRLFLAAKVEVGDIQWASIQLGYRAGQLARKGLSPKSIRHLVAVLEGAGVASGDLDLHDFVDKLIRRGSTDIVETLAVWLSSLNRTITKKTLNMWAWNCLNHLMILERVGSSLNDALSKWADPPTESIPWDVPADLSDKARGCLARLLYYQRICGQRPSLPKSLRGLIAAEENEARELEYLGTQRDAGKLDDRMASRLNLLENRTSKGTRRKEMRRIERQAEEVCAHVALEALKHVAYREGRRTWNARIDIPPPEHLSDEEMIAVASWVAGLDKETIVYLADILNAWSATGGGYRRHLLLNQRWISKASSRPIELDAWLKPQSIEAIVETTSITICVSPDPFHVFLMGNYFDTCLSLDDFNKDSVLANAYDANKAVVFALGPKREVLARKLVCVSSGFELIGYRTYVGATDFLNEDRRETISRLVDAYCGRWASTIGLPLGATGEPETLSKLFWYDDGVERWRRSAVRAWDDATSDISNIAKSEPTGLPPSLKIVLEERRDDCLQLLGALGIWPPSVSGSSLMLSEEPCLAEEALAILARNKGDPALARLVFDNAATEGGTLEALTSFAYLEGPDVISRFFSDHWESRNLNDRMMSLLCRIGTPSAWAAFMKAFSRYNVDELWVPLFAAHSDVTASEFASVYCHPGADFIFSDEYMLVTIESLRVNNRRIPDAVLAKALRTNSPFDIFNMVQWLPPLAKRIDRSMLRNIDKPEDWAPGYAHRPLMAAIVLALRNPGATATAYLRQRSETSPSALLVLSMQSPRRFRAFIRKTALAMPTEGAAILALVVLESPEAATELLAPTFGDFPNQEARVSKVCELFDACRTVDLPVVAEATKGGELWECLPFILDRLWTWTDIGDPDHQAIHSMAAEPIAMNTILDKLEIFRPGLAVKFAALLRWASPEERAPTRKALLALIRDLKHVESRSLLLLDHLSGHQAFAHAYNMAPVKLVLGSEAVSRFLFDETGQPRPIVKVLDWDNIDYCVFPLDPNEAARLAELLTSNKKWKIPVEILRTSTEIQKRLLAHYAQNTRPSE